MLLMGTSLLSAVQLNPIEDETLVEDGAEIESATTLKIGIAEYVWDPIDDILDDLGLTYTWFSYDTSLEPYTLQNLTAMKQFDLIFLPCGTSARYPDSISPDIVTNVKQYVQEGGVIYASDWAAGLIEQAFPGRIDFKGYDGDTGYAYNAYIQDDALRAYLGKSYVDIEYDLPSWAVINSVPDDVSVIIKGDVPCDYGTLSNRPMAVRFTHGLGTVIYTTFHNEAQITAEIKKVLEFYIQSGLGFTLLPEIYNLLGSDANLYLTFVGNLSQGQMLYLNLTDSINFFKKYGFFDVFLNWQGSSFNFLVDGVYYGGPKPYKLRISDTGNLGSKNITMYANQTTGAEFCIAAFVVYGQPGGGIPGFEFIFGVTGILALISIYLWKRRLLGEI
jgi:hypothetical protein